MRQVILIFSILLTGISYSQSISPKEIIQYKLGESKLEIHIYEKNFKGGMMFIHVHENETASLQAGLLYIQQNGGRLVTLKHSFDNTVNRNIKFNYKNKKYEFDPNRIFSNDIEVLDKTLKSNENNRSNYLQARNAVDSLGKQIWGLLKNASYLVSLHNNKNKCVSCERKGWFGRRLVEESYNVTSYVQKCDIKSESNLSCEDIYINPKLNNSEFFIVTQKRDFDFFLKNRFSVVLQNSDPVDDGSMSVYAVKNNMRYINAEAKQGRLEEQIKMLDLIKNLD